MKILALLLFAFALVAGPARALPIISTVTITKQGTGHGTVSTDYPSGGGQSCAPGQAQCTFTYLGRFMDTLVATPDAGSVFVGWAGCYSAAGNACSVSVGSAIGANVQIVAVFMLGPDFPDFSSDGKPDLLWRHAASGTTFLWRMDGPTVASDAFIGVVDPAWKLVGVGDFNGDGRADIVWRHATAGVAYVWFMDGPNHVSDAFLFSLPPEWVVEAVADLDGDGKPDLLMRNADSGVAFAWFFDGTAFSRYQFLFTLDPAWRVEGVGDFDGDGQPDLLGRNAATGETVVWYTRYAQGSLSFVTSTAVATIDPAWQVVQVADWNGDGSPDVVLRHRALGVVAVWYLNGITPVSSAFVTQVDPAWEIVPAR